MYPILAMETTGALGSVAVKDEQGNVYPESLTESLNHLKGLLPLVDKALDKAGLDIGDVKTIAVSHGPGSFTGIRIGISTARALAQITGARIIGVPTQEAFVFNDPMYGGIVCPIFDARMEQMYAGAFILQKKQIKTLIATGAYTPNEYFTALSDLIVKNKENYQSLLDFKFFGDGIPKFERNIGRWENMMNAESLGDFNLSYEQKNKLQEATSVLEWAERFGTPGDYRELMPVYVRKAEAQRRLDEKNACGR